MFELQYLLFNPLVTDHVWRGTGSLETGLKMIERRNVGY